MDVQDIMAGRAHKLVEVLSWSTELQAAEVRRQLERCDRSKTADWWPRYNQAERDLVRAAVELRGAIRIGN